MELRLWVFPEERGKMLTLLKRDGAVRNLEVNARRKGGEVFWTLYSVNEMKVGEQNLRHGAIRDITERKKNEEIIRISEEKFSTAFRHH